MTKKLLMGNEAMAHAALEAGVRVVAGYPGTPSSEIVETVARLHAAGAAHGVHVEWSTNEKAALELLFGASLAGARGLFTCKQMGLNVASDALMSLNYVSVRGGLVLVVADDPGPISSQTEQDTRRFAAFAKVPVLDPATPEQAFDMVKAAFELSERFHTPVIVRPTTRVDHASAFFDVDDETFAKAVPDGGFERDASKWVIFPRRSYQAHGEIIERLHDMASVFANEEPYCGFNFWSADAQDEGELAGELSAADAEAPTYGILAGGISAAYTREALRIVGTRAREAGLKMPRCRFMQVGTPYPFPEETIAQFVEGVQDVLVIEELDYVLEDALATWAGRTRRTLGVHGKLTGEARDRGENDIDDIAMRIERFLGLSGRLRMRRHVAEGLEGGAEEAQASIEPIPAEELPQRPPVLCPGCPHRGAFYAVKQALRGKECVLCGDIGCYTLGNAKPLDAVDTCLCMGAGITMAQGLAVTDPGKKAVAFVGDSTFFASGMTGLANAAYNGHDITVMVLDNATTAMTGSQPHPGTGRTLMGAQNTPLSIEAVLVACGFTPVYHANPLDLDSAVVAAKAAISHAGPSAVIFESPCIQLIKPSEPVVIDVEKCTGCKRCITTIGCPAIGFDASAQGERSKGRGQAVVDPSLCNGCGLCTQVCSAKAIDVLEGKPTRGRAVLESARKFVGALVDPLAIPQRVQDAQDALVETAATLAGGAAAAAIEERLSAARREMPGDGPASEDADEEQGAQGVPEGVQLADDEAAGSGAAAEAGAEADADASAKADVEAEPETADEAGDAAQTEDGEQGETRDANEVVGNDGDDAADAADAADAVGVTDGALFEGEIEGAGEEATADGPGAGNVAEEHDAERAEGAGDSSESEELDEDDPDGEAAVDVSDGDALRSGEDDGAAGEKADEDGCAYGKEDGAGDGPEAAADGDASDTGEEPDEPDDDNAAPGGADEPGRGDEAASEAPDGSVGLEVDAHAEGLEGERAAQDEGQDGADAEATQLILPAEYKYDEDGYVDVGRTNTMEPVGDGEGERAEGPMDGFDRFVFEESDLAETDVTVDESRFNTIDFGAEGEAGWSSKWSKWSGRGGNA